MERDPNLGRVISKSSGIMLWWDMRDSLPLGDFSWVDVPSALSKKDGNVTLEPEAEKAKTDS